MESWGDLGDDICALADKAFPNLGADGRQQLALHHYLVNLSNRQVMFSVRQKKPTTVEGAVAATLEVELFLLPVGGLGRVAHVGAEEQEDTQESLVAAVKTQQEAMVDLMSQLVQRMEKLESREAGPISRGMKQQGPYQRSSGSGNRDSKPVICFNCGQEGHFRRGCAKQKQSGNANPSV